MWIADAAHSRSLDRRATEEYGIPPQVLMERAGLSVLGAVRSLLPDGGRIAVLCGKGHNGGDGLVVARVAKAEGYVVDCLVAAAENDLAPATADQLSVTRSFGVTPIFPDDARYPRRLETLGMRDLVVDALLGTGTRSEVHGPVAEAIEAINRSGVPVVSVDLPSGIHCDTGEELGNAVWALRTVTFGQPKPFLFQGEGIERAGYWTVDEIGFPRPLLEAPTAARLATREWVSALLPERRRGAHKGDSGGVLIVAGSRRMRGAAILCARAALRAGAGLVTVASIPVVIEAVAAHLPEVLLRPLPETDGAIAVEAADELLSIPRVHAAVFGPGLSEASYDFLGRVWAHWDRPSVLDADALNAAASGVRLPDVECVLTPHPGEMGRLLAQSVAEVQADRFQAVRNARDRTGRCVLLKGPSTLVVEPGMPISVNSTGNEGLATGGTGDVLSGVVGTLLAQELPAYHAAVCGAYWHGAAADLCAESVGPVGYTASEVADALPRARANLVRPCGASCSS